VLKASIKRNFPQFSRCYRDALHQRPQPHGGAYGFAVKRDGGSGDDDADV
jgi:hypothetical protein